MSLTRVLSVLLCLMATVAPAFGQQADAQNDRPKHYVIGTAGAAFGDELAGTLSGEYGEAVGRSVIAFINYAYYDDLMSDRMRDNLFLAGDVLTSATGNSFDFSGRDRGLAFTGGFKAMFGGGAFRPYVGGGAGVLHLQRKINEATLGDVTTSFVTESGLNDGVIDVGKTTEMMPLGEAIFGLQITSGRILFDVSYRFRKPFHADTQSFSQFSAGVGVAWF